MASIFQEQYSSNQSFIQSNISNKSNEEQKTALHTQNLFCQTLLDNSYPSPLRNSVSTLPQPDLNRISRFFQANGCNTQNDFYVREIPKGFLRYQPSILHFHSKNHNNCSQTNYRLNRQEKNNEENTNINNCNEDYLQHSPKIENFYEEKYFRTKEKYKEAKQTIASLQNQLQQISLKNQKIETEQANTRDSTKTEQIIEFKKKYQILKEKNDKSQATVEELIQQINKLKNEINKLKATNDDLNQKMNKSNDTIEKQTLQIKKLKDIILKQSLQINKNKDAGEKQNLQINKCKAIQEKQILKIKQSKIIIEKQSQQILQLQNKISELLLNTNSSNQSQNNINNTEIKKSSKENNPQRKRGHFHFKGTFKTQTKRSSSAINQHHHFELTPHPIKQYKYLCNMLNVEPDEFDQQWNKVFRKIADLLNSVTSLGQSKDSINEHISFSHQLISTKKIDSNNKKSNSDDTFCELDLLRKQYDLMNKKFENLRLSSRFGNLISKYNSKLYREIEDLHASLTMKKLSHFREIILTVIFANRMLNGIKNDSYVNEKSLTVFAERPLYSTDVLLRDIRSKFTSLDQDLVYSQHLVSEKL